MAADTVVTIVVPGGFGTTLAIAPTATSLGPASASSVCSSLSSQACFGLQSTVCQTTGTVPGGFYVGTASPGRPTAVPCAVLAGAVAAGVGVGLGMAGL